MAVHRAVGAGANKGGGAAGSAAAKLDNETEDFRRESQAAVGGPERGRWDACEHGRSVGRGLTGAACMASHEVAWAAKLMTLSPFLLRADATVSSTLCKQIVQARTAKKMTQVQLAQVRRLRL
jgi:hypothetical protein